MNRAWKRVRGVIVLAASIAAGAGVAFAAPPGTAGATLDRATIEPRDGAPVAVDYGTLEVPENRDDPASRKITLAFVRVPSPLPDPGPPVFIIAGGPGGSSIDIVESYIRGGGADFLAMMGGDVVGIDQRGVGRSVPNLESSTLYGFSPNAPGDRDEMLAVIQRVCREEAARWKERGVDLRGYTTVQSADDIDAVRAALGYDTITLWGGSYGSHLAMATIRRHGDHVSRALLTAPEGPDHTYKLPTSIQAGLERIAERIAADPEASRHVPDFLGSLAAVLTRLDAGPVFVEVDGQSIGISKFDVQRVVSHAIGTIRGSGDAVPAMVKAMADGDFEEIARMLAEERSADGIGSAMQAIMDCSSGASPERLARIAREAGACMLGDAIDFPMPQVAEAWGAPDLGAEYRSPLRSDIPILFIVGDMDTRTPVRNAEELMQDLPNAKLIVVTNAGHNDLPLGMPELRAEWTGFLAGRPVTASRVEAPPIRWRLPRNDAIDLTDAQLDAFVGTYDYGQFGTVILSRDGDKIFAKVGERPLVEMIPASETELIWTAFDARLVLVRDASGAITGGTHVQGDRKIEVRKVE